MLLALSDVVWVAIVNVVCGGLIAIVLKWLDLRSTARAKVTSDKVDQATLRVDKTIEKVDKAIEKVAVVDGKVEEVQKAQDGMTTKLVAAGKLEATHEERDRAAAIVEADAVKEAEITRRVEVAKAEAAKVETQKIMTTANGPAHIATVAANVSVIKSGVKAVQRDVTTIKEEVTKEVREGVDQGISDAKDREDIENRADRELDK